MSDWGEIAGNAEAEIAMLRADGIEPTPAEIVKINALAWQIESPHLRLSTARGIPVPVGGAWLWPLTIAAMAWYEDVGAQFATYQSQRHALAYAMSHGYDESLATLRGPDARRAVGRWASRLRCRKEALDVAMAQVLAQGETEGDAPPLQGNPDIQLSDIAAGISALTGMAPEHIERRMSFSYAVRLLNAAIVAQSQADNSAPDPDYINAEREMGYYLLRLRKSRQEKQEGKDDDEETCDDGDGVDGLRGDSGDDIHGRPAHPSELEP
jgi:hypothetical protein